MAAQKAEINRNVAAENNQEGYPEDLAFQQTTRKAICCLLEDGLRKSGIVGMQYGA